MVNAQEWLDKNYPKEKRDEVKKLIISGWDYASNKEKNNYSKLTGYLDLTDFKNLEFLDVSFNSIESVNLAGLTNLKQIHLNDNLIKQEIDFSSLDPKKLIFLNISDNNLPRQDISAFSHLINLKFLWIGCQDKKKIEKATYNRFYGSWESLCELKKLKSIEISNTDISDGVDFFPESLIELHYSTREKTNNCLEFEKIIKKWKELKEWKKINDGFDEETIKNWKKWGLNENEATDLIDVGFLTSDYELAYFWKSKNVVLSAKEDLEALKEQGIDANEWMNFFYSSKKRNEITCLNLESKNLTGNLDLRDFKKLKKLDCSMNKLTSLSIDCCEDLEELNCNYNQISFLNCINFEKLISLSCWDNQLDSIDLSANIELRELFCDRNNLTKINLRNNIQLCELSCDFNSLKELDLSKNTNLVNLSFSNNYISEISLTGLENLKDIKCESNFLTNLDLSSVKSENLTYLNISNNNFFEQDLSLFSRFTNLTYLLIYNTNEEKIESEIYNRFVGSLKHLENLSKLYGLYISDTDIDSGVEYLPERIGYISYSCEKRPSAKIKKIKNDIDKFLYDREIERVKSDLSYFSSLKTIAFEDFENVEYLAEGGYGTIYKAEWGEKKIGFSNSNLVALKVFDKVKISENNFYQEVGNHWFLNKIKSDSYDQNITDCYGISQDSERNQIIVMEYAKGGDLRSLLKRDKSITLAEKLLLLEEITQGLKNIHKHGLVHRDLHPGNILNNSDNIYNRFSCLITDLGFSGLIENFNNKLYGVLPYVAPEVLQGQPYTQASDIYSFGIITYELLANSYPYPKMDDLHLLLKVCKGLRPKIEKLPIPQLLKDLIERCWDSNPEKRPTAEELKKIIESYYEEIEEKKDTEFYQQYQEIESEHDHFSQNTPYQIHPTAVVCSKPINTKKINEQLYTFNSDSLLVPRLESDYENFPGTQIEIPPK